VAPLNLSVEAELAGARAGFMGMAEADPEMKALEAEYPGIFAFVYAELEPVLREQATRQWPRDIAEFAQLYDTMLKPAEIAALDAYYRTETGQRTIRTMFTGIDLAPVLAEVLANPDGEVSAKTLASSTGAAKRKVMAELGPADEATAKAMLQGIGMAKLAEVGAAVQKLSLKQANAQDPASEALLNEATDKAFEKFIARHDAKR
jgi:hypothetical protein